MRTVLFAALLLGACRPLPDTGDTALDTGDTVDTAPPDAASAPPVLSSEPPSSPHPAHQPSLISRIATALRPGERASGEGSSVSGDVALHEASDLRQLRGVLRIEGALRIRGSDLMDLSGLESLERVGDLEIIGNPRLTDLSSLRGLRRVDGALHLDHNVALRDLHGLERLERVGVEVAILNNDALTDISALRGLHSIGLDRGWCGMGDAPALAVFHNDMEDFAGLEGLQEINGLVNIYGNGRLRDEDQHAFAARLPTRPCLVTVEPTGPPPPLEPQLPRDWDDLEF